MNSLEKVKVLSEKTLSISEYNEMSDDIMKGLGIFKYEDLRDYFILVVELKGKEYTFVHASPENKYTEIVVKIENAVASPKDNGW